MRVGVLMGGLSTERAISLKSGRAVAEALRERGHDVVTIDVGRDLPERLRAEGVDVAWIALHGRFGEDGCVQGLLEVLGIPYTGSGVLASAVCMDKAATKRALRGVDGVVLAADVTLRRGEPIPEVPLPAVVKPAVGGSTLGIHKVADAAGARAAIAEALALDPTVVVEAFVAGPEVTVAVLDGVALPVVGIVPDEGFFDFEAKYTKGRTRYEVPATVPDDVQARARAAAETAYRALGCRGLARADFIVRDDGIPVFLEINTLPGMTPTSLSPMAASLVGISFGELCERVLATAHRMEPEPPLADGPPAAAKSAAAP
jgi:D-alanine-D-alanine ligase